MYKKVFMDPYKVIKPKVYSYDFFDKIIEMLKYREKVRNISYLNLPNLDDVSFLGGVFLTYIKKDHSSSKNFNRFQLNVMSKSFMTEVSTGGFLCVFIFPVDGDQKIKIKENIIQSIIRTLENVISSGKRIVDVIITGSTKDNNSALEKKLSIIKPTIIPYEVLFSPPHKTSFYPNYKEIKESETLDSKYLTKKQIPFILSSDVCMKYLGIKSGSFVSGVEQTSIPGQISVMHVYYVR